MNLGIQSLKIILILYKKSEKNMIKRILYWSILCVISTTAYSQSIVQLDKNKTDKGTQIIKDAQKAIGTERISIDKFSLKTKVYFDERFGLSEVIKEVKVLRPDKISVVSNREQPFPNSTTEIWNGTKYSAISVSEVLGKQIVTDITNARLNGVSFAAMDDKIKDKKINKAKKYTKLEPKEVFKIDMWYVYFPLTLIQPFEQNLEFKYVGKAKSGNRIANVVDVNSENGRSYRLLFDSETKYLLLMIESFEGSDGGYENKYYYTNREMVNSLLIPRNIKVETKLTPTGGKEPKISYTNIDILEFNVNSEFKKNMFEIK